MPIKLKIIVDAQYSYKDGSKQLKFIGDRTYLKEIHQLDALQNQTVTAVFFTEDEIISLNEEPAPEPPVYGQMAKSLPKQDADGGWDLGPEEPSPADAEFEKKEQPGEPALEAEPSGALAGKKYSKTKTWKHQSYEGFLRCELILLLLAAGVEYKEKRREIFCWYFGTGLPSAEDDHSGIGALDRYDLLFLYGRIAGHVLKKIAANPNWEGTFPLLKNEAETSNDAAGKKYDSIVNLYGSQAGLSLHYVKNSQPVKAALDDALLSIEKGESGCL